MVSSINNLPVTSSKDKTEAAISNKASVWALNPAVATSTI
jgi:hypothetical protein